MFEMGPEEPQTAPKPVPDLPGGLGKQCEQLIVCNALTGEAYGPPGPPPWAPCFRPGGNVGRDALPAPPRPPPPARPGGRFGRAWVDGRRCGRSDQRSPRAGGLGSGVGGRGGR